MPPIEERVIKAKKTRGSDGVISIVTTTCINGEVTFAEPVEFDGPITIVSPRARFD